jgi:hypothetical protein
VPGPFGLLADLRDTIRRLPIPPGTLGAECVHVGAEQRREGEPEIYLRVWAAGGDQYGIVVDEVSSVFRWVSGPDVGMQAGSLWDLDLAARMIARRLAGLEIPPSRRGRR